MLENTYWSEMLYNHIVGKEDDLVEIDFYDMEPIVVEDVVGVPPYQAIAMVPTEHYDFVGVEPHVGIAVTPIKPIQSRAGSLELDDPDMIETEEFSRMDEASFDEGTAMWAEAG